MTVIPCFLCEKPVDTKKDKLMVTVSWVYEDLLKLNDLKSDKSAPRVVSVCSNCWDNKLKKKPDLKDKYWVHHKEV